MIIKTLICGFTFAALTASSAWAGEKSGHIFGGPVIFESTLSYGWMRDTSDQGLIRGNADGLIVNNAQGGVLTTTYEIPGIIFIILPTTQLNYDAPLISATVGNTELVSGGFSHSQELNFGIRSEIADGLEAFIRFEYARLKSNGSREQDFNIFATALTSHGRSNILSPFGGGRLIEAGQISQTFTGAGSASIGFSDMDTFNFNVGMKKNIFQTFDFANVQARPFVDFAFGMAATNAITFQSTGQLLDLTDIVTADFSNLNLMTNSPGFITVLPNRAVTSTAATAKSSEVISAAVTPTVIVGAGIDFSLSKHTSLSVDVRYKFLKIPSKLRTNAVDLSRLTLGLRLSQSF